MKSIYLATIVAALLLATSCTNKYEQAITDFFQSADGTMVDMSFDLKEAEVVKEITVADSIAFLNKVSELEAEAQIAMLEANLQQYQQELVKGQTGKSMSKMFIDAYTTTIQMTQVAIDSLRDVKPMPTIQYEGRKANEVLAIVVAAKYEVSNPMKIEVHQNFVLSPDAKVCYRTTNNVEMDPAK